MKKNWYWLIPIVVAFIVGYFWRQVDAAQITSTTDYDVFFRLLTILLSLLVGAGALIYLVIRRLVTESIQDDIKKRFSQIQGKLNIHEGVMYYYMGAYKDAIETTKGALEFHGENLEELDEIWAKSNLAYYYAAKHVGYAEPVNRKPHKQWETKDEAIKLAKVGYDKYDPFSERFNQPYWVDNYVFVRAKFAETSKEKWEVSKLIRNLLPRKDLSDITDRLRKHLDSLGT